MIKVEQEPVVRNQTSLDLEGSEIYERRFEALKKWYQERDLMLPDNPDRSVLMKNYGDLAIEAGGVESLENENFKYYIDKEIEIVKEQVRRGMDLPTDNMPEWTAGYAVQRPTILNRFVTSAEQSQFLNSIRPDISPDRLKELAEKAGIDYEKFIEEGKKTGEIREIGDPCDIVNPVTGEVETVPVGRLYVDTDRSKYHTVIAVVPKYPRELAMSEMKEIQLQLYEDFCYLEQKSQIEPSVLDVKPYLPALVNFSSGLRFDYS